MKLKSPTTYLIVAIVSLFSAYFLKPFWFPSAIFEGVSVASFWAFSTSKIDRKGLLSALVLFVIYYFIHHALKL